MEQFRIGVIEDDYDDFILVRDLLRSPKYLLDWFPTYESGKKALVEQAHDIFLIDFNLGAHNGLELIEEISALEVKKPMILMTGQSDNQIDVRAMERGVSNFLPKQIVTLELLERSIRFCLKVSQDVQRYKELEQERAERRASDKAIEQRAQFLARVSHEIRSPLTAILGYAEIGQKGTSIREKDEALAVIQRNGGQLLNLINDFLNEAKMSQGEFKINPIKMNYQKLVTEVADLYRPLAQRQGVQLRVVVSDEVPLVFQDETRIRQILNNLISNAIKATARGEVVIRADRRTDFNGIEFSVQDSGRGIQRSNWEKIFEPFFQVSGQDAGTGLGLSVARRLARLMGGDLFVSQSSPSGSTFVCRVQAPLVDESACYRILVVDDSPDLRNLNRSILESAGLQVLTAADGEEALSKCATMDFDLILMDQEMPRLNGISAAKQLRVRGYRGPIVLMTAHDAKDESLKQSGITDVVQKPLSHQQLLTKVQSHCYASTQSMGSSSLAVTKPYSRSLR